MLIKMTMITKRTMTDTYKPKIMIRIAILIIT